jgi:hypothetical protein
VFFKIVGQILGIETIASGKGIRERRRLRKFYGGLRWRKLKGTATVKLADGTMCYRSALVRGARHWQKKAQDQANSGNPMKRNELRFVVCVKNKSYAASLELRKLYQVVADETAAKLHQIRVIDESGEDYLYPEEYFVPVQLPQSAEKAVRRAAGVRN